MLTLLLVACGPKASVEVEGAPPFEDVGSVVWTLPQHTHLWILSGGTLQDVGDTVISGSIALHAAKDQCDDAAETLAAWEAASVDLLGASADGTDTLALCEGVPAWLDTLADVDDHRENGTQRLSLSYCIGEDCAGAVEATSYALGDTSSAQWSGTYTLTDADFADGRYTRAAAAWNVDTCTFDETWLADEADATEVWSAVDGDVVFDEAAAEQLSGSFDGSFDDTHGNRATLSGTFSVGLCEMPEVSDLVYVD